MGGLEDRRWGKLAMRLGFRDRYVEKPSETFIYTLFRPIQIPFFVTYLYSLKTTPLLSGN